MWCGVLVESWDVKCVVLGVVVLGVLAVKTVQTYMSGAAEEVSPKNVTETLEENGKGAVISWISDKESMGVVEYGTSPASLLLRAVESNPVTNHQVSLSPLKSGTTYYYRIKIGDEIFDKGGMPYYFKTKEEVLSPEQEEAVPTVAPKGMEGESVTEPEGGVSGTCNRQTDYNTDGVVNSLDYIYCMKNGGSSGMTEEESTPSATVTPPEASGSADSECTSGVDYDGNGVVNSLDRIRCLQKQI